MNHEQWHGAMDDVAHDRVCGKLEQAPDRSEAKSLNLPPGGALPSAQKPSADAGSSEEGIHAVPAVPIRVRVR